MNNPAKNSIEFLGFEVSPLDYDKVCNRVAEIRSRAPSDSEVSSQIVFTNNNYEGTWRVVSASGEFISKQMASTVNDLMLKLWDDMLVKLGRWKSSRFSEDPDRQLEA